MLSAAIKYVIGDICLNLFFDRIFDGFDANLSTEPPKVGDTFSRISHKFENETFYDCYVEQVDDIFDTNGNKLEGKLIYIRFRSITTDDEDFFDEGAELTDAEMEELEEMEGAEIEKMTDEERAEFMVLEDDDDMSDADLVRTDDPHFVGVNSEYYNFYR